MKEAYPSDMIAEPAAGGAPAASADSSKRQALLRASFVRAGDRTVMADKFQSAPIKIAKAFPLNDSLAVMVMDVSPGMLEEDSYDMEWKAGPGTSLYVTNQSYMKVHPCPGGGKAALRQTFLLGEGAFVQHMPEPVMLYRDAALDNATVIRLAQGAAWMQAEVVCPGRTFRGELFRYRELRSRLTVYAGEELIFSQHQRVQPALRQLDVPGAWEDATHWGTLVVFSEQIKAEHAEVLREELYRLKHTPGREVLYGVTLTYKHGLAVSAAGKAAWPLQAFLRHAAQATRQIVFGKEPLTLSSWL